MALGSHARDTGAERAREPRRRSRVERDALAQLDGGAVVRAPQIMHGKLSEVAHDSQTIFRGIKNPFAAMRYHSLVIDRQNLPEDLTVSAQTADGVIMAVRHKKMPVEGVQFHPESILAEEGKKVLQNFLDYY